MLILFFFRNYLNYLNIEEGFNQKTRQRTSHRIGGQNPCRASCFALVFLKQTVCRDVDKSEFGTRLSIFHYCSWRVFSQYLLDYLNIHETIPGLYSRYFCLTPFVREYNNIFMQIPRSMKNRPIRNLIIYQLNQKNLMTLCV